ncbi:MAG: fasciclin domain-containing protein [Bacteroidetes bacterium]|nr:MAG: fasciclin domain-containing protein [Bacteroidota bacterium]REJ99893.1 MAG: fasciclin domain-containing protein [Bacteroidota bacterium]REK34266.1 MAG: fasciclin domain-containing protein [Bacteroidota bacterium]REK50596.1 MAG: fasciclin domain-containing protein [Bacteroidota bacterium]
MKKIPNILAISIAVAFLPSCNPNQQNSDNADAGTNTEIRAGQSAVEDDVSQPNVVKIAIGSKDHTTLVKAVVAAELVDALSNNGPFTVFAPTDAAFSALPAGTLEELMKKEKKGDLENVLYNHVIVGSFKAEDFRDGQEMKMFGGKPVKFTVQDGKVQINGANILATVPASNGYVLVIDAVL